MARRRHAPVENVARYREREAASNVTAVDDAVAASGAFDGHSWCWRGKQRTVETNQRSSCVVGRGRRVDLRTAGFDFPREAYVEHLRATNELPDLAGTLVLLALTPPAGAQPGVEPVTERQPRDSGRR